MLTTLALSAPFVFAPAPAAPCVFQRCDPCAWACILPPPEPEHFYCDDAYLCAADAYQNYLMRIIACNGNYWCCDYYEGVYVDDVTIHCPALCEVDRSASIVWCQLPIAIPDTPPEGSPPSEWNVYWCQLGVSAAANLELALCGCCDEECCEAVHTSVPLRWANCRNQTEVK